jgi:hypothetical protein
MHSIRREHSVDTLFMLLLFGLFALLLLLLLLFSAKGQKASVSGLDEQNNLRTAMSYLTGKFRQHDDADSVFTGKIEDTDALCFTDTVSGRTFDTYIYLDEGYLKEVYTAAGRTPTKAMGTPLCSLEDFSVEETEGLYHICLVDANGRQGELYLHPGPPSEGGTS